MLELSSRKIMIACMLLVLLAPRHALAGLIEDLGARQKGLASITATFDQEKHTELLGRPIKNRGKIYFKAGAGVRWEYDGKMLVIYDGKSVYLHYPELGEADKVTGASEYIGPLTFDIPTLVRDYKVDAVRSGKDIVLDLRPKKRMPFASMRMTFGPEDAFPREITVTEESGDSTAIRFHDIKKNAPLSGSLFVFTPPSGLKVRERGFGR